MRFLSAGADLDRAARAAAEPGPGGAGLVVTVGAPERIVAHAAYVRESADRAEVAFEVADAWHGRGIATILLAHLAEAAERDGVAGFVGYVHPTNHRMIGVFRDSGFPVDVTAEPDELAALGEAARQITIAATAIVVNLLSVGAAYGILVAVFQNGVAIDLLGFTEVERIDSWVPIFLFSVLFGLSMDYQVFLLSRIHEHWAATGDTPGAIVHGVASTARLITGAAAIIIVVFAGFASGQLVALQEMGFGIAVALALDATLVRLLLIPAAMRLLGDRNWYLPRWLAWLPDVHVEGPPTDTPAADTPAADPPAATTPSATRPVAT